MVVYRIGTAGWSLPGRVQNEVPGSGTHLQRYASRFPAVEINSSFYRLHRRNTYERWADSVPPDFRFAVKIPKAITHDQRLVAADVMLDVFLADATALGDKLGCLLVQLPPSLAYVAATAETFFRDLRAQFSGAVAFEPRHASWFTSDVADQLRAHRIARVAADPAPVPAAAEAAGSGELVYIRLHGSPKMYYSAYDEPYLDRLADRMKIAAREAHDVWCIFDNTALDAALPNAISLVERLA
ncbi:MAG TPA: DUF72 domain-containing protein [Gemmatimonadaceae bacterium]|nr:DUF72 domain-containing protein [Gemmatimonadaceae bacterium]